jgi:hypothetical protein
MKAVDELSAGLSAAVVSHGAADGFALQHHG